MYKLRNVKHNNRKTNKYDINKANINISINTVFKIFAVFCHYCDGAKSPDITVL